MQAALILEVPLGFRPGNEGFRDLYFARYCGGHFVNILHVVDFWRFEEEARSRISSKINRIIMQLWGSWVVVWFNSRRVPPAFRKATDKPYKRFGFAKVFE